jgi:hypothetical protein
MQILTYLQAKQCGWYVCIMHRFELRLSVGRMVHGHPLMIVNVDTILILLPLPPPALYLIDRVHRWCHLNMDRCCWVQHHNILLPNIDAKVVIDWLERRNEFVASNRGPVICQNAWVAYFSLSQSISLSTGVPCIRPSSIANGRYLLSSDPIRIGTRVLYSCIEGYTLDGASDAVMVCESTAQWNSTVWPTCRRKCMVFVWRMFIW